MTRVEVVTVIRQMMVCKSQVTWGGKVCYGKSFGIVKVRGGQWKAVCDKCGKEHEVKGLVGTEESILYDE